MNVEWNKRFIRLAMHVGAWSKDPSTQVGAVIVDEQKRIVSIGFNGPPRGTRDGFIDRDQKLLRTIHAEKNAILFAHGHLEGTTLYCTHHPCAQCAAMIVQAGIKQVFYRRMADDFLARWQADVKEAEAMFVEAGVPYAPVIL